jgi:hypothetical protein
VNRADAVTISRISSEYFMDDSDEDEVEGDESEPEEEGEADEAETATAKAAKKCKDIAEEVLSTEETCVIVLAA